MDISGACGLTFPVRLDQVKLHRKVRCVNMNEQNSVEDDYFSSNKLVKSTSFTNVNLPQ